jgi:deoxyribonuclease IV
MTRRLGFHIPIAGGWRRAAAGAVQRGCTTLQIFTSAPVQWARRPLDPAEAAWFADELARLDIQPLFVHAPYLLNIAATDRTVLARSLRCLAEELTRSALFRAAGVVLHTGSVGASGRLLPGLRRAARTLDRACEAASDPPVPVILENSAGGGGMVGHSVEQLAEIVSSSRYPDRLQVCLDTAHAFGAGCAVNTPEGLDEVLALIDKQMGEGRLALVHANDTQKALGSRADRHWHIGEGNIGADGFRALLSRPRLADIPFIMETPGTIEDDVRNMATMRRLEREVEGVDP